MLSQVQLVDSTSRSVTNAVNLMYGGACGDADVVLASWVTFSFFGVPVQPETPYSWLLSIRIRIRHPIAYGADRNFIFYKFIDFVLRSLSKNSVVSFLNLCVKSGTYIMQL